MADNIAVEDANGEIYQTTSNYAEASSDIEMGVNHVSPLQEPASGNTGGKTDPPDGASSRHGRNPDSARFANWPVLGELACLEAIYEYAFELDGAGNKVSPHVKGATKIVVSASLMANIMLAVGYAVFGVQTTGILLMLVGWHLENRCPRLSEKLQIFGQVLCVSCLLLMQASVFK